MTRSHKYALQHRVRPVAAPLTAAVGLALAAQQLQAATITVDTLADTNAPGTCSLRSAIQAANQDTAYAGCAAGEAGSDTIEFAGISGVIELQATPGLSLLTISSDLIINGPGMDQLEIRPADGVSNRVLGIYAPADSVTINNLTIANGYTDVFDGGGIFSACRALTLNSVRLSNNASTANGGGLFHRPETIGSLTIQDSIITGNTAGFQGGGFGVNGSVVQVTGTAFYDNVAGNNGGGAFLSSPNPFTLIGNVFDGNQGASGGGLFLRANEALVQDTVFTGNSASGLGGGMTATTLGSATGSLDIRDNLFEMNSAPNGGGLAMVVFENTGDMSASVLYNRFYDNSASDSGGALFMNAQTGVTVTVGEGVALGNTAVNDGGFMTADLDGNALSIRGLQASNNEAGRRGGAAFIFAEALAEITLEGSVLSNNRAQPLGSDGKGGALYLYGNPGEFAVLESVLSSNRASQSGGGLYLNVDWTGAGAGTPPCRVKYSQISNNQASDGAGAALDQNEGACWFIASTISGNTATIAGGGIFHYGSGPVAVVESTVAFNTAPNGGGIYNYGKYESRTSVLGSIISDNAASTQGPDILGTNTADVSASFSLISDTSDSQLVDVGNNVLNQSAQLQPLANNGGPTLTHAILAGSPAIDAGSTSLGPTPYDQRGAPFARLIGDAMDMGAYEQQTPVPLFSDRFEEQP
ncbi:CSLREA domain-containing protein [Wenzhouxiangella marina]|uniref:Uncharacterized protein n=1 Tax=Wenzhouxiangella marina TaxID=1579979 RepID=A0A0K0XSC9_9GAMM|nr:CSLREA domain-containing protein [Wenzhouxiangella marina]AKS40565.1 hypothetical protein WM2015_176 [Wenzhouxiangella marina]MBB6088333.1 CSLREA domain-containing protein [Wenzhouxiangella marina]